MILRAAPLQTDPQGWIAVSDYVHKGQDLAAAGVALSPVLARNPTFFCTRFLLRAGTHHFRSTLTDQYIACEAAVGAAEYTAVKVVKAILDADGPADVHDFTVEPFPAPDPSMEPPIRQDWKEETGCEQYISSESLGARVLHVEERHGYDSLEDASTWGENAPWQLLVKPYALNHQATVQLDRPWRCERVISYVVPVGYEYNYVTGEYSLTSVCTVITEKDSGDFVTAFPGIPGAMQP